MRILSLLCCLAAVIPQSSAYGAGANNASPSQALLWESLPAMPDREGFAGSFAGVAGGALIVAGGANFPQGRPWEGGAKMWYDRMFMLEDGAKTWREAGRLPCPAGYGVSVTFDGGVLLVGGGDASRNFSDSWFARRDGTHVRFMPWPALPRPLAQAAGARVGRMVYVAGGLERPDATEAQRVCFALDLDLPAAGWRETPPFPGSGRLLATAGSAAGAFYLFGGAKLVPGWDGKPQREWLRDAWRFTPTGGWKRLADLPRAAVAAPSPAPLMDGRFLVLGGDDGAQAAVAPNAHRGFARDVLAYDPAADAWHVAGDMPFALVTTPAVMWGARIVVLGGEAKPGVRSNAVWAGRAAPQASK